jgi:small subunit ribosomal protein S8
MTDPITDMLNQIKSGQAVGKTDILVPFSKIKNEIALILSREGFLGEVKKTTKGDHKALKISLKYNNDLPAIEGFKRVSKPGQRIYQKIDEIKKIRGGYGLSVISTSKGLMTGKEAKVKKIGGEVICEIW